MITDDLADLLQRAVFAARDAGELTLADEAAFSVAIQTPNNKLHGDYASNLALTLKKVTGISDSRDIAVRVLRYLPENSLLDRIEVAGPGFINFYLKPTWLYETLAQVEAQDICYGTSNAREGERVLIEFVSANPTGPISVVNGRAAALGDVLGNLLASQGAVVSREFYINDALNSLQMELFAESVYVRYLQLLGHPVFIPAYEDAPDRTEPGLPETLAGKELAHFPANGYRGEYVKDIARSILARVGAQYETASVEDRSAYFRPATLELMLASQKAALEAFGVFFDTWYYESSLYETYKVDQTIQALKQRGYAYEKDGALWLRSSTLGDEKDRVLVRSNEKATYIAADTAYHHDKFVRGFSRLINIWGADHHGYVARLKAGVAAMGHDPRNLEIILTQMVALMIDGKAVTGGKRGGNVIELKEDLVEEIGRDAARFYFLLNSYETPATVDVEMARKQSNENPVYYVQYAHARLCNILRRAEEQGFPLKPCAELDLTGLTHPSELDVLRALADYPAEVTAAAQEYAPHRLTRYAMDMASLLNIFYENCRVLSGKEETVVPSLTYARLALVNGSRIVLRNLLGLLGVTAPDRM